MIFVISGPSGCGKSTLVKHVLKSRAGIDFSVSYTTRQPRDNEVDSKDYYFISDDTFNQMIQDHAFAEWATVHGHLYGTAKKELGKKGTNQDLLLDIDVQGAEQIREKMKKGIFIFILPPSYAELKKRLEQRGQESPASIRKRLDMARKEIRSYSQFDYIIINDGLEEAVEQLEAIVLSHRCRLDKRQKTIVPILRSFSEAD